MNKIKQHIFLFIAVLSTSLIAGCDNDNEGLFMVTSDEFDARLNNNTTDSLTATVFLSDVNDNVIDVLLSFTSTQTMRRVYITRNIQGQGDEKIDASEMFPGADAKRDGSLDLGTASGKGFEFDLDFPTAGLPDEGTVVYKLWATSNKGDFRDPTKNKEAGVATLTIQLSGSNPAAMLRSDPDVTLMSPTGDARSMTFISTLDGSIYQISEGEEYASFWDFGFYYGTTGHASLASTAGYPNLFSNPDRSTGGLVNVFTFLGIDKSDVNRTYFVLASDATDFSSFTMDGDLNSVLISPSNDQVINDLVVGNVVYILDQYGKKGVLKVKAINPTFNSDGFITFDLKTQR